jgi:hypothetical protein
MISKQELEDYVSDLFSNFLYYDRKEDDDFTLDDVKTLPRVVTREELIEMFTEQINQIYE